MRWQGATDRASSNCESSGPYRGPITTGPLRNTAGVPLVERHEESQIAGAGAHSTRRRGHATVRQVRTRGGWKIASGRWIARASVSSPGWREAPGSAKGGSNSTSAHWCERGTFTLRGAVGNPERREQEGPEQGTGRSRGSAAGAWTETSIAPVARRSEKRSEPMSPSWAQPARALLGAARPEARRVRAAPTNRRRIRMGCEGRRINVISTHGSRRV